MSLLKFKDKDGQWQVVTGTSNVVSFNGRAGAIKPQMGDYTAEMVGADSVGSAAQALEDAKVYVDEQFSNIDFTETDPTVPAWAKEENKPTYTADEVGAAPSSHNHSASDITSGILDVARGGTGVETLEELAELLGTGGGAQMALVSYTGVGSSNPIDVIFPFEPDALLLYGSGYDGTTHKVSLSLWSRLNSGAVTVSYGVSITLNSISIATNGTICTIKGDKPVYNLGSYPYYIVAFKTGG